MNFPLHFFRLQTPTKDRPGETVQVITRAEARADKPVFRAPALPTPHQLSNEVPFTANFRPRLRERP
jgi:hypothetical protein